jgi:hypothetical protein
MLLLLTCLIKLQVYIVVNLKIEKIKPLVLSACFLKEKKPPNGGIVFDSPKLVNQS